MFIAPVPSLCMILWQHNLLKLSDINNILFNYISAQTYDTRNRFEKVNREAIPMKGPLTKL